MMIRTFMYLSLFFGFCSLALTSSAWAQASRILVVDLEKLYETSKFGRSIRDDFNSKNQIFNEENKVILQSLKDEEIKLTKDRSSLSQEVFALAAAAFDVKVQEIRINRLEKIRLVEERFKLLKPIFLQRIDPFFDLVMREFKATAILQKNLVVRSSQKIDITNLLIERVDQAFLGDGGLLKIDPKN